MIGKSMAFYFHFVLLERVIFSFVFRATSPSDSNKT